MILFVLLLALIGPLSLNLYLPALPAVRQEFQASVAGAQLTVSLALMAAMAAGAVSGIASDRWGRRPAIAGSLAAFLAGAVLAALAPTLEWLMLGRALVAGGGTSCLALARAVANDAYDEGQAVRLYSWMSLVPVLAAALGPVAGGAISDAAGWRWTFWLLLPPALFIAALLARVAETRPPRVGAAEAGGGGAWRHVAASPVLVAMLAVASLQFAAVMTFVSSASLIMGQWGHGGLDYGLGLIATSAGLAAGALAAGRLSDRLGRLRVVALGAVLAVVGPLAGGIAVALFVPLDDPLFLFGASTCAALGIGLVTPTAQAEAMARSGAHGGLVSALLSLCPMLAGAVFVQGVGMLGGDLLVSAGAMFVLALALALLAVLRVQPWRMKPSASTA